MNWTAIGADQRADIKRIVLAQVGAILDAEAAR
jgi:hypothetical protein